MKQAVIAFSEAEGNELLKLLDCASKYAGLQVVESIVFFKNKLTQAFTQEPPKPEQPKLEVVPNQEA